MNLVRNISLSDIVPNPNQPRTEFDPEKLKSLSESIRSDGMIQPVVVRKNGKKYEIIAGERRCRAAKLAGLSEVPCLVMNVGDNQSARMALVENIQRENLNPIEEAEAYRQLMQMDGCTQEELAKRVGKTQSTVANKIRLLKLSEPIREALQDGDINEHQARALLAVPEDRQMTAYYRIKELNLNTAGTERLVREMAEKKPVKRRKHPKGWIKDARIVINTVRKSLSMLDQTNIQVVDQVEESEDGYTMTIHISRK